MEIYARVLSHPNCGRVQRRPGDRRFVAMRANGLVDATVQLTGITKPLELRFWPEYYAKVKQAHRWLTRKARRVVPGSQHGYALGTRIHHELHIYTKVVDFLSIPTCTMAEFSRLMAQRKQQFETVMAQDGSREYKVHPCTRAILEHMTTKMNCVPVSAEWAVGDVKPGVRALRCATQIDSICVPMGAQTGQPKLILCEVKTGFNSGKFNFKSGPMLHPLDKLADKPLLQACVQLVLSAALFIQQYELSWDNVTLAVIHCPAEYSRARDTDGGLHWVLDVRHYVLSPDLVSYTLKGLGQAGFL